MAAAGKWLDWDAVASDAAGALDRTARPRLFDRLDWFAATHAHGLAPGPPAVARAGEAWLFLAQTGHRRAAPLASWYSLAFGPIGDPADFAALFATAAQRFDAIALHPVADADRAGVEAALRASGWTTATTRISTNWTGRIDGRTFADWWADRPGALRATVARKARRHPVTIKIFDRFGEDEWDSYQAIYAASWKPAEGSFAFLHDLAEREGAAVTLRLGIARDAGGRPVAAQLWLVEGGVATIHKLAHRADADAGSPGTLLTHAMMRAAIDGDRVARVDFGLGDEPYKADWLEDAAPVWRIDAWRPRSLVGLAGLARNRAARLARRLRSG